MSPFKFSVRFYEGGKQVGERQFTIKPLTRGLHEDADRLEADKIVLVNPERTKRWTWMKQPKRGWSALEQTISQEERDAEDSMCGDACNHAPEWNSRANVT